MLQPIPIYRTVALLSLARNRMEPQPCLQYRPVTAHCRFIYIHVMKTGGNTFQSFLQGALCGDPSTNRRLACDWGMRDRLEFMPCTM